MTKLDEFVTIREAARFLGVAGLNTLRNWHAGGENPRLPQSHQQLPPVQEDRPGRPAAADRRIGDLPDRLEAVSTPESQATIGARATGCHHAQAHEQDRQRAVHRR